MIRSPNAVLRFQGASHPLWIMEYSWEYGMAGQTYQSKTYRHWYPLSYRMSPLHLKGRVQTQQDYADLAEFIRGHQIFIGTAVGLLDDSKLLTLDFPSEGILVAGVIKSFDAGRQRFNPAPPWEYDFEVWRDHKQDRRGALVSSTQELGWLAEGGRQGESVKEVGGGADGMVIIPPTVRELPEGI